MVDIKSPTEELPTVIPYLCVTDAASAIAFYTAVFAAVETERMVDPDGRIAHAQIQIDGAPIFLADEFPEIDVHSPTTLGGSPVTIHLVVDDVDSVVARAAAAGATTLRAAADQPHGHRNAKLSDPFGHVWIVSSLSATP